MKYLRLVRVNQMNQPCDRNDKAVIKLQLQNSLAYY